MIKHFFLVLALSFSLFPSCTRKEPVNRTLTILLPDDILSIEPNREFETITDSVLFNVYEPLVGFDKDMNLIPMLAESWQNPRSEEWRFHLRKNVLFHDGTPLTAPIARDILLRIREDESLEAASFLQPVDSIAALDEHTLAITTSKPYAFLSKLPFVYLSKANTAGTFPPLVGTGAYQLIERKPGESIRLRSSGNYWGGKTEFSEAEFIPVRNAAERFSLLSESKADIIYAVPPQVRKSENLKIRFVARPGLAVIYLSLNVSNSDSNPLSDVRVRKAIHLSLNRQEIVDQALMGNGTISTQAVAPSVFGYNPQIASPEFNPQKARQLLNEAGYSDGFAIRLDFNSSRIDTARLIEKQLAAVRVKVQLNEMGSQALSEISKSGATQMLLIGWDCSSGDASEFYEFCMHTASNYYGDGNYGFYSNAEIDEIARTNMLITDQRKRRSMLQRAAEIIMNDLPVLPLYVEDDVYGMRKEIEFDPRADHEIRLADIRYVSNR